MKSTFRAWSKSCLLVTLLSYLWVLPAYAEMQQCRDVSGRPYFTDLGCPVNKYNNQQDRTASNSEAPEPETKNNPVPLPEKYKYTPPQQTMNPATTRETRGEDSSFFSFKAILTLLVLIAIIYVLFKINVINGFTLAKKYLPKSTTEHKEVRFNVLSNDPSIYQTQTPTQTPTQAPPKPEQAIQKPHKEPFQEPPAIDDETFLIIEEDNLEQEFPEADDINEPEEIADHDISQDKQALEKELLTHYTPERPLIFDVESLSNNFKVGEKLLIFSSPLIKDLLKDLNQNEILYANESFEAMLSQKPNANEAKKIFRLIQSHERLDIRVFLKEQKPKKRDDNVYYSYKIQISAQ